MSDCCQNYWLPIYLIIFSPNMKKLNYNKISSLLSTILSQEKTVKITA